MSESDHNDVLAKWRDLIGGFILAFGDIEIISHRLWRDLVKTKPVPVSFKERTSVLLGHLRRDEEKNREVIVALVEALRIAHKRNTVAHNPMQVQVYEHSETGRLLVESAITSVTDDDYIDDVELFALRAKAEELVARLYRLLGLLGDSVSPTNNSPGTGVEK
jgi:hypothetical protein